MASQKPIENAEQKLSPSNYAKYDRPFMLFGSVMNALQGNLNEENWQQVADKVWEWAKIKVDVLVDDLYSRQEIPVVDADEEEPEI